MSNFKFFYKAESNAGTSLTTIGDLPELYKASENNGKLTLSAKIHMKLDEIGIPKKQHYQYISQIINKEIDSVKNMNVAEAKAFLKYMEAKHNG